MSRVARRLSTLFVITAALGVGTVVPVSHVGALLPPPDTTLLSTESARTNDVTGTFSFSSVGGATFECRVDLGLWAACSDATNLVGTDEVGSHTTSPLAEGFHTFEVRAADAGVTDPTPATFVWFIDLTPPTATFVLKPASTSNEATPYFVFASEAAATYTCAVDGGTAAACSVPFVPSPLADGPHILSVRATDSTGNAQASPTTYIWTVDTTRPTTSIERLGPTISSDVVSFTLSADETATFACNLDGSGWAACPSSYTTPSLSEGTHTLLVTATDTAGNADSSPASEEWVVDTTAPDTIISTAPATVTDDATAGFEFSATESPVTFECNLDDHGYAPCSSPFVTPLLADGSHTFSVRATDSASQTDSSPATYTWSIGVVLPETGRDVSLLLALASALVAAGSVLTLARRRPHVG